VLERYRVVTVFGDAVKGCGRQQQGQHKEFKDQRREICPSRPWGKTGKSRVEYRLELKAEENLRAENQYPRFVQDIFDFVFELGIAIVHRVSPACRVVVENPLALFLIRKNFAEVNRTRK